MDAVQFIFESPQETQSHKKRPRLVTSCDNCRHKKIKCILVSESNCEACSQSKVSCRFRDREAYFVERSRTIAAPRSRSSFGDPQTKSPRKSESLSVSPPHESFNSANDPTLDVFSLPSSNPSFGHCRTQSFPSDSIRFSGKIPNRETHSQSAPPPSTFDLLNAPFSFGFCPSDILEQEPTFPILQQQLSFSLFDLNQPQYPHTALMQHYIHIFVQQYGSKCPFITYSDTLERFTCGILPPLLSNCIASLAARFSNLPELIAQGLGRIANIYAETAKNMLPAVMYPPCMETLHALMLLAWSEYHYGTIHKFRTYSEMAMRMALNLGLSENYAMPMSINEQGRNLLRATWAGVIQLDMLASTCKGIVDDAPSITPIQPCFVSS